MTADEDVGRTSPSEATRRLLADANRLRLDFHSAVDDLQRATGVPEAVFEALEQAEQPFREDRYKRSGRLRRCIPIGEYRDGAYRVTRPVLEAWGGLSCRDGYLQRSAVLPSFSDARRFFQWFERQGPDLVSGNNP